MIPDALRFYAMDASSYGDIQSMGVYDADQRLWYTVTTHDEKWDALFVDDDEFDRDGAIEQLALENIELVKKHVDTVAPDIRAFDVENSGNLKLSTHTDDDNNVGTYYPALEEYEFGTTPVKTILRSEVTELDRLSSHVDLVSYAGMEKAVFKYFYSWKQFRGWQEINIHARLPSHPNILPLDRLVLEEVSGSRVVGFTTPYVAGADLATDKSRRFKMKWLRQLMQVVDDLNLKFGIVHQDMAPRNLLVDSATDNILLFDFGEAAKIGGGTNPEGEDFGDFRREWTARNDVKGVIVTLHEIITRDPCYSPSWLHLIDETDLVAGPDKWVKHPDVELDDGLTTLDYYEELIRWVRKRRGDDGARPPVATSHDTEAATQPVDYLLRWVRKRGRGAGTQPPVAITHDAQSATHPIDWPPHRRASPFRSKSYNRKEAEKYGLPYVEWVRPRTVDLDRSRRLLATGRYADEVEGDTGNSSNGGTAATTSITTDTDSANNTTTTITTTSTAGTTTTTTTTTATATTTDPVNATTTITTTITTTTTTTTTTTAAAAAAASGTGDDKEPQPKPRGRSRTKRKAADDRAPSPAHDAPQSKRRRSARLAGKAPEYQ